MIINSECYFNAEMKKNYEFTEDRFEELSDDADIDALLESLPEIGKSVRKDKEIK